MTQQMAETNTWIITAGKEDKLKAHAILWQRKERKKDSGWIENNGDSELENAMYVDKLIYIQYYFVAVCNDT